MTDTKAILSCPHCLFSQEVEMPTNYYQIVFHCKKCGKAITPKKGECCVFCSYADKKCPPKQEEGGEWLRKKRRELNLEFLA